MGESAEKADRAGIAELVERYAAAVCDGDGEDWIATWAEDATWDLMGSVVKGHEAIRAAWQQSLDALGPVVALVHDGTVEVDGDTAVGWWLVSERLQAGEAILGYYDDSYGRVGDGWRFTQRTFSPLHQGPAASEYTAPEIVIIGTIDMAAGARSDALERARPHIEGARTQDGCLAYVFAADPVVDDRISVHEHWRDAASLEAHLSGPHYRAMLETLGAHGVTAISVAKHEIRRSAPVYGSRGVATASFLSDA